MKSVPRMPIKARQPTTMSAIFHDSSMVWGTLDGEGLRVGFGGPEEEEEED